jgi:cation diffusion facilitator family transporter
MRLPAPADKASRPTEFRLARAFDEGVRREFGAEQVSEKSNRKVVYVALAANAAIAVTKFGAGFLTGSSAMLSEGVHSVVDTGNEALLLLGMNRSKQPATERHPFGFGREIYFWAFVVSVLIFMVGACLSVLEGVHSLLKPQPLEDPLVNYAVLGAALVFEGISWFVSFRAFRRTLRAPGYLRAIHKSKDPTNFVVLLEDSAAIIGLVIAFVGVFLSAVLDVPFFDSIASILIGVVLACVALLLAYECKGLLIGESAAPETVAGISRLVSLDPRVEHTPEVLTLHLGPEDVLLGLNIDFRNELSAGQVEGAVRDLETRIRRDYPEIKRIFIEAAGLPF